MGAGLDIAARNVQSKASTSTCKKCSQWVQVPALLQDMASQRLEADVVSYNASTSACVKCSQWVQASASLQDMASEMLEAEVVSYNARTSTCKKCPQWMQASALPRDMASRRIEVDVVSYNANTSAGENARNGCRPRHCCETRPVKGVNVPQRTSFWNRAPRGADRGHAPAALVLRLSSRRTELLGEPTAGTRPRLLRIRALSPASLLLLRLQAGETFRGHRIYALHARIRSRV
jgi:hypothetical protein